MNVLIKGIEMPKGVDEHRLIIRANGQVIIDKKTYFEETEAVPVPPHGRLIDADAFKEMCLSAIREAKPDFIRNEGWIKACAVTLSFCKDIDEAPTIIEAEGE